MFVKWKLIVGFELYEAAKLWELLLLLLLV